MKFLCSQCAACYSSKTALEVHVNTVHENVRPYMCEHCSKGFGSQIYLQNHIKMVHSFRTYDCKICQEKFSKKYDLRWVFYNLAVYGEFKGGTQHDNVSKLMTISDLCWHYFRKKYMLKFKLSCTYYHEVNNREIFVLNCFPFYFSLVKI